MIARCLFSKYAQIYEFFAEFQELRQKIETAADVAAPENLSQNAIFHLVLAEIPCESVHNGAVNAGVSLQDLFRETE